MGQKAIVGIMPNGQSKVDYYNKTEICVKPESAATAPGETS